MNDNSQTSSALNIPRAKTPSVSDLTQLITTLLPQQDIRLCTIYRADADDVYGIELNYHCRKQSYELKLTPGRDNGISNAELAGIKEDDCLIEVNGQNIETVNHEHLVELIRAIKYPEPLQMLVTDAPTYMYYKEQQKRIHHDLPNVKIMPANTPVHLASADSSLHRTSMMDDVSQPSLLYTTTPTSLTQEDIGLCPMYGATRKDTFDFQFNNHCGECFYSISSLSDRDNGPSNTELAGMKEDDRLIEVNGQNIETVNHEHLAELNRAIKYPEPLQMLVTDAPTYISHCYHHLNNCRILLNKYCCKT